MYIYFLQYSLRNCYIECKLKFLKFNRATYIYNSESEDVRNIILAWLLKEK